MMPAPWDRTNATVVPDSVPLSAHHYVPLPEAATPNVVDHPPLPIRPENVCTIPRNGGAQRTIADWQLNSMDTAVSHHCQETPLRIDAQLRQRHAGPERQVVWLGPLHRF